MLSFRNLSVRVKMILCVSICLMLTITASVIAIRDIRVVSESYDTTIDHPLTLQRQLLEFQGHFRDVRRFSYVISTYADSDIEQCESTYKTAQASIQSMRVKLDEAQVTLTTNPKLTDELKTSRLQILDNIRGLISEFETQVLTPLIEAARQGDHIETRNILSNESIATQIRETSSALIKSAGETSAAFVKESKALSSAAYIKVIIILVAAGLLSIAISIVMSGIITKPLRSVTEALRRAGETGDLHLEPDEALVIETAEANEDEVGKLSKAALLFIGHISEVSRDLDMVAKGDLSVDITPASDKDILGISLQNMIKKLSEIFDGISESSSQVSASASQIADGSQTLATGAAEQTISLHEIENSVSQVKDMIGESDNGTREALDAINEAGTLMALCLEQMDRMLAAMREISEKSNTISKTTQVIDDIAFQTNILALNAAVEAARAGQHGKGFAVVAEEVRRLASKSAEAAKETESLISSSHQSVVDANDIVAKVEEDLRAVAVLAQKNAEQVSTLKDMSSRENKAVEEVLNAVDKVARVIQQNSATAQESAAASEEMNAQAAVLFKMISQFRLQESRGSKALIGREYFY